MPVPRAIRALPAAALCLSPAAAAAQQAPPDTVVPLAPVTVTVLRTPLDAGRAPFAVTVNGPQEVRRARPGLGLDEALRAVPGVQVDNRYNYALGERISIRGFGARAQFGVRGVKVLVDGIPATLPDGQTSLSHVDLSLLSRAEVLRGPASALWGNTAGGVIQLHTAPPPERPLAQEAGLVAGSDGLLRLHSTTGGRSGAAAYQLHLSHHGYDGYREFSDARSTRLSARLGWSGRQGDLRLVAHAVDYDARNPGSLSGALLAEDRGQAFANNRLQRTGEEGRQAQLGAVWTRAAGPGEVELSGYWLAREIANPIPTSIIDLDRRVGGLRAMYRGAGEGAALTWSVGAEADAQSDDRRNFANQRGERAALALDQRERVVNAALFAQAAAEPLPDLTLLAGLRYDWFRFRADDRLVAADNPDDSGSRTLDALSPSLGASYRLGDALSLYANVATSFETPTTTELANRPSGAGGLNPELEPQEAVSVEAGARGRLGDWGAYQLAVYRADIDNALIAFEVPEFAGRQFFRNAGSSVHRGVEASVTAAPSRGVRLQASYTLTDARFRRYVVDGEALDGNRVPGVAPHRAEAVASLDAGPAFLALEARYSSRLPVNDANTAHSPAYWVADARAGLDPLPLGRLEVEPFAGVTNLLDREYNASVVVNAFGGRFFEPGPGRSVFVGARVRL